MRSAASHALAALLLLGSSAAAAQPGPGAAPLENALRWAGAAGTVDERTVSAVALLSNVRFASIRPHSARERDTLLALLSMVSKQAAPAGRVRIAPLWAQSWVNTRSANPDRDGPVWQGRGLTAAVGGGVVVEYGPLKARLNPIAWVAENADFRLNAPVPIDPGDFRDPYLRPHIDMPYRFGAQSIWRVDPGDSELSVGWWRLSMGVSTAAQQWGPAQYFPLVMGTEGGGYPRVFVDGRGLDVWIGRVSAQWSVGRLESSRYANLAPGMRSRIVPALVGSFQPAALPGLELGATRFFHVRWIADDVDWNTATLPFSGLFKSSNPTDETFGIVRNYNQLASIFARVAPPGSGAELYAEFFREDHNHDTRDLIGEPDHQSAYTIGVRRVLRTGPDRLRLFVLEAANGRISHLDRVRNEPQLHTHGVLTEGHTFRGQPLANSAIAGGGGVVAALQTIRPETSSWLELEIRRAGQDAEGGTWGGVSSGTYGVRAGRTIRRRGAMISLGAGVRQGFGWDRPTSLEISAGVRR